ncbi:MULTISPECIES: GAF domain-containing protein [Fischerella]|uniref:GAF domain-containing protein n=1 Tax=Fischerella TaxID=1190 RepID=UPI0002F2863A|nr:MULTISPECIES: GAF domain-containing protein [Fischerella]MBD2432523.1 GAF domain-containing protein [Fischerella sp. FACHB-380]
MKNNTQDNQEITDSSADLTLDANSPDATMQNLEQSESRFNPVIFGNSSFRSGNSSDVPAWSKDSMNMDWLFTIAKQMRQAEKIDTLLAATVTEVQQYLHADRVLLYQLQSQNQGVVLAESMVNGYTPSLKESLPIIAFGTLLYQIVTELRLSLQSLIFRNEQQALARVSEKARQTIDEENIFQTTTREVQKLLNVERVAIYKFNSDYCGHFVFESKVPNLHSIVGKSWDDTYLKQHQGGLFRENKPYVVDDVARITGGSDCYLEAFENFQIEACAIAPIFVGQELWGLLCAYQHSDTRHWLEDEIKLHRWLK